MIEPRSWPALLWLIVITMAIGIIGYVWGAYLLFAGRKYWALAATVTLTVVINVAHYLVRRSRVR